MIYVLIAAVIILLIFMFVFGRNGIKKLKKPPKFLFWKVIYTDMYTKDKTA